MFIHHCSFCLKSIGAFLITAMDAFAATEEMRNLVDLRHLETIKADLGDKLFVILDYSGRVYPAVTAW